MEAEVPPNSIFVPLTVQPPSHYEKNGEEPRHFPAVVLIHQGKDKREGGGEKPCVLEKGGPMKVPHAPVHYDPVSSQRGVENVEEEEEQPGVLGEGGLTGVVPHVPIRLFMALLFEVSKR